METKATKRIKTSTPQEDNFVDSDALRALEPTFVSSHAVDIYKHLHRLQFAYFEPSRALAKSLPDSREVLVAKMISICDGFEVSSDCLFLSVGLLDRILTHKDAEFTPTLVLATTCVWLACKYEELCIPSLDQLVEVMEGEEEAVPDDLVQIEYFLLFEVFDFKLSTASTKHFCRRLQYTSINTTLVQKVLCDYLAELSLTSNTSLSFSYSLMGASCMFLSRFLLPSRTMVEKTWTSTLRHYAGYKAVELFHVVAWLWKLFQEGQAGMHVEVYEKFQLLNFSIPSRDFGHVKLPCPTLKSLKEGGW